MIRYLDSQSSRKTNWWQPKWAIVLLITLVISACGDDGDNVIVSGGSVASAETINNTDPGAANETGSDGESGNANETRHQQ